MWQRFNSLTLPFVLLLAVVNVVFLDLVVFSVLAKKNDTTAGVHLTEVLPASCPSSCEAIIEQKLVLLPTPSASIVPPRLSTVPSTREFYIPLGSGKTTSREYEGLPGVEVAINTTNYPQMKSVLFEATMHLFPGNGAMLVKLYNVTDGHDVWFSEMSLEGGTKVKKEAPVTLDPGNKLYRVMVKSTLGYEAIIDNARIRIITE